MKWFDNREVDHAFPASQDGVKGDTLRARDVCRYMAGPEGRLTLLEGVNLSLKEAESVAIVGPSGAGKSTLLGLLAGLDGSDAGEIELLGQPLHKMDEDKRAHLRLGQVGFVFQMFHLLTNLTALENVLLPLELAAYKDADSRARHLLRRVGLEPRLRHYPNQLSGGEQQRVAIARAFVGAPRILFADEPTGNLDTATGALIVDLIFALQAESDCTLLLVTHDKQLARRCDRTLVMEQGKLRQSL